MPTATKTRPAPASKKAAPKVKAVDRPTLVTFLLDSTQSMQRIKGETLEAFNTYVNELKVGGNIDFTLVTFNRAEIARVHHEKPIQDVPELMASDYHPQAMTPLIEAAIKTIQALDKAVAVKDNKPKVVFCIQTDGEENCSGPEYTWDVLKALIADRKKNGWQFNFMGAGIDAYDQGQRMGMTVAEIVSYDPTKRETTRSAFVASGVNTRSFAFGSSLNTNFTLSQKSAAGDAFDPGNSWITPTAKKTARKSIVDDIVL